MLASFKAQHLLRVKGIVNVEGEPFAIDVVQSVVHTPLPLDRWPSDDKRTRLVFIVRDLAHEDIERTYYVLAMTEFPVTARFDPGAYAKFSEAAMRFI